MNGFYLRSLCHGEVCYQDVIGIICNAMDEKPVFNTYLDDLPGGSLNRGLSRVTFVIPALNEANNLCGLRETLGKQIGCHTEFCVMVHSRKVLKPVLE